jgi:NTP pyrophosphatase (non-canonical NTP hydrolase)
MTAAGRAETPACEIPDIACGDSGTTATCPTPLAAIAGSNLAGALAGEAGELLELFQWLSEDESRNLPEGAYQSVAHETADIQIYLATLSDRLGIDIGPAVAEKMKLNAEKYPPDLVRGNALKYSKLKPRI